MLLLRVLHDSGNNNTLVAGIGYRKLKACKRLIRSSFYGHMRSQHRFPHEGSFRAVLVWVCGRDVHHFPIFRGGWGDPRFEQLILGWMDNTHGTAGKVPQNFNKATWSCIWSSQIDTRARHGNGNGCVSGAQGERYLVRSRGGLLYIIGAGLFTVVKGN